MRGPLLRLTSLVVALAVVVLGAVPAAASAEWVVTPGGPALATPAEHSMIVRPGGGGADMVLPCRPSSAAFTFFSSPDSHVADITSIDFGECVFAGLVTFEVDANTPWSLHALSYDTPVVSGELRGVSLTIHGAGCLATVEGFLRVLHDNTTGALAVVPDFTLAFTSVDPVDNCLGLLHPGDLVAFDGTYDVTPPQHIVPV